MRTPTYRPQRHSSKQASARGAWARLHSLRLDNSQCIRPPQELEQLSSRVRHSRVRAYGSSKRDVGLDLGRERCPTNSTPGVVIICVMTTIPSSISPLATS